MPLPSYAVAVTCIDGRIQDVVRTHLLEHCGVDHIDAVTVPGVDAAFAADDPSGAAVSAALEAVGISLDAHASTCVVVAGHTDCAANPVEADVHRAQVKASVEALRSRLDGADVRGILVDTDAGRVEWVTRPPARRVCAPEGAA